MERANEQWKSREVARLLALVETERLYYQEMVTNLPISVAVVNTERILVYANRAFRQTYGVSIDQIRKAVIESIFSHEELKARIHSVFESGLGSRPLEVDWTPAGAHNPKRLRFSIQAVRDWDELQALMVVEDLTGSPAALLATPIAAATIGVPETLTETPARATEAVVPPLAHAVEAPLASGSAARPALPDPLPCVIWTAHASGRAFIEVSSSAKALLEIEPEEWIHTEDFFNSRIEFADQARVIAFYDQALAAPGLHSAEFRMRRPGNWYRETILVEAGAQIITGVITDITARHEMEEQILHSQRFEAVTHLAGRMAHDINNPLMIVNGYAEDLAAAFASNDPRSADVQEIQMAGKRIGELTGQLQFVTRKQQYNLTVVDIDAGLARVVERMRTVAGEYLQADHKATGTPLAAMADPAQLDSILLELSAALVEGGGETAHLILSAKAHPVSEFVRPGQPLAPGDYVEISILNQSQAAPYLQPNMFEAIMPGREAGREAGPALARVYKTLQEWGGAIDAVHELNEIRVFLKAVAPVAPPTPEPVREMAVEPATPEPPSVVPAVPAAKAVEYVRKTNILIVEDEPGIRALMRKILQREGFEVLEAANAMEALDILKKDGPFNLLITDVKMPGMNGLELATQVRQMDPYCGILYMSGFTAETGVETGQFPPGSHFLQKPFTLGSLLRKANEVLAATARRPVN